MQSRTRIVVAALAVFVVAEMSAPAQAQMLPDLPTPTKVSAKVRQKARKAYNKAQHFFQRNKLLKAHNAARRAYNLVPAWATALALAQILLEMDQPCAAFRHALVAADLAKDANQRAKANIELGKSGPGCKMGAVRLEAVPAGVARVAVGNVNFVAPRTVGLRPGKHTFRVSAPGMKGATRTVTVRLGLLTVNVVELEKVAVVAVKPKRCDPPKRMVDGACVLTKPTDIQEPTGLPVVGPSPSHWEPSAGPWVLIGIGAAAVVTGGVLIGLAQAEVEALNELLTPRASLTDLQRQTQYNAGAAKAVDFHNTGLIVGGIGLAALVAGVVWKVMDQPSENTKSVQLEGGSALQLTPWISPTRAGLLLRGGF